MKPHGGPTCNPSTISDMGAVENAERKAATLSVLRRVTLEHSSRPQFVEDARQAGATWAEIAEELGMSVTAARKIHAKLR